MARRSATKLKTVPQPEPALARDIDFGWLGGTVGLHLRLAQEAAFQAYARRATGVDAQPVALCGPLPDRCQSRPDAGRPGGRHPPQHVEPDARPR